MQQRFEQRAIMREESLPVLPASILSFIDVQQYVRLWDAGHFLASFSPGDTLLECVHRFAYRDSDRLVICTMGWHPTRVKVLFGRTAYLLSDSLSQIHHLFMRYPHTSPRQGITKREWIDWCQSNIRDYKRIGGAS